MLLLYSLDCPMKLLITQLHLTNNICILLPCQNIPRYQKRKTEFNAVKYNSIDRTPVAGPAKVRCSLWCDSVVLNLKLFQLAILFRSALNTSVLIFYFKCLTVSVGLLD